MLTDTHLHLQRAPDPDRFIHEAGEQGVSCFFAMCAAGSDIRSLIELKGRFLHQVKVFSGCHPAFLDHFDQELFEQSLRSTFVDGIGEVGLDRRGGAVPLPQQCRRLQYFLDLACDLDLPVSLHCVKAHQELTALLRRYGGRLRCCVHGLNPSAELAQQYLQLNCYLGLGRLLIRRGCGLFLLIKSLYPELRERLLLESDFDGRPLPADFYLQLQQAAAALAFGDEAGLAALLRHNAAEFAADEKIFLGTKGDF